MKHVIKFLANSYLNCYSFTFDPFMRHNFWNFLFGYGFAILTLYGTHQPQVQRYCSLPSLSHAIKLVQLLNLLELKRPCNLINLPPLCCLIQGLTANNSIPYIYNAFDCSHWDSWYVCNHFVLYPELIFSKNLLLDFITNDQLFF